MTADDAAECAQLVADCYPRQPMTDRNLAAYARMLRAKDQPNLDADDARCAITRLVNRTHGRNLAAMPTVAEIRAEIIALHVERQKGRTVESMHAAAKADERTPEQRAHARSLVAELEERLHRERESERLHPRWMGEDENARVTAQERDL